MRSKRQRAAPLTRRRLDRMSYSLREAAARSWRSEDVSIQGFPLVLYRSAIFVAARQSFPSARAISRRCMGRSEKLCAAGLPTKSVLHLLRFVNLFDYFFDERFGSVCTYRILAVIKFSVRRVCSSGVRFVKSSVFLRSSTVCVCVCVSWRRESVWFID